jgi:hypothetical protein
MDMYQYLPADAMDYVNCVRTLAALIYKAQDEVEKTEFVSDDEKSRALQRLADSVETIACLRGDSGIFYSGRPTNLVEYQEEMYQIEDTLRSRLISLGYTYPKQ